MSLKEKLQEQFCGDREREEQEKALREKQLADCQTRETLDREQATIITYIQESSAVGLLTEIQSYLLSTDPTATLHQSPYFRHHEVMPDRGRLYGIIDVSWNYTSYGFNDSHRYISIGFDINGTMYINPKWESFHKSTNFFSYNGTRFTFLQSFNPNEWRRNKDNVEDALVKAVKDPLISSTTTGGY